MLHKNIFIACSIVTLRHFMDLNWAKPQAASIKCHIFVKFWAINLYCEEDGPTSSYMKHKVSIQALFIHGSTTITGVLYANICIDTYVTVLKNINQNDVAKIRCLHKFCLITKTYEVQKPLFQSQVFLRK